MKKGKAVKFIRFSVTCLFLIFMVMFSYQCGNSSSSVATTTIMPAINSLSIADGYTGQSISTSSDVNLNLNVSTISVDPGMYVKLQYGTEYDATNPDTFAGIDTTAYIDSNAIPLSFYLVSADAYKNDTDAASASSTDSTSYMAFLGSDFYSYKGGSLDLVIPEDVVGDSYYRILTLLDPNNEKNVINRDGVKLSFMSDSFYVTNSDSSWVEISDFKVTSKVAVYSDSDWKRTDANWDFYDTKVIKGETTINLVVVNDTTVAPTLTNLRDIDTNLVQTIVYTYYDTGLVGDTRIYTDTTAYYPYSNPSTDSSLYYTSYDSRVLQETTYYTYTAYDTQNTYETKIVSRPGHIQVNFDINLRGKIAKVTDTTYVGFYLELWQEEDLKSDTEKIAYWENLGLNTNLLDNTYNTWVETEAAQVAIRDWDDTSKFNTDGVWADLKVLEKGDSKVPDKFMYYFPIAAGSDSTLVTSDTTVKPPAYILDADIDTWLVSGTTHYKYYDRGKGKTNKTQSFTLDLWMPDTTARLVNLIDSTCKKTVWKVVMFVQNKAAGIYQADWGTQEEFTAKDYVRIMKIDYQDLFPDGSRAPRYAGSSWFKFNDKKTGISRNDYSRSGGGFGCRFDLYAEQFAAAGRDGGFIQEDNVLYTDVTVFGHKIVIFDIKNTYKGIAYDVPKSYRKFYFKLGPWTLLSDYDELGTGDQLGLNADPFVEWSKTAFEQEKTFLVGPVPVTAKISLDISLGLKLFKGLVKLNTSRVSAGFGGVGFVNDAWSFDGFSSDFGGKNFVGIVGRMTPYGVLSATGQIGVGGGLVSAGFYLTLEFIRVELPVTLGIYAQALNKYYGRYRVVNSANDWYNRNYTDGRFIKSGNLFQVDEVLSTLSGSFGLYAEIKIPYPRICWWCHKVWKARICLPYPCGINYKEARYELPIVSWNGLSARVTLFKHTWGNQIVGCYSGAVASPTKVALLNYHHRYFSAHSNGGFFYQTFIGAWEQWEIVDINGGTLQDGDKIRLHNYHNRNLGSRPDFSVYQHPNPYSWETWTIDKIGAGVGATINYGDKVGFLSAHGRYLSNEASGRVIADRSWCYGWEQFTLIKP